jgi:NADPH:quinone reductase-like Zn-dependent oxidoreductase
MRAVTYDPAAPAKLAFADIAPPVAGGSEALIDVRAVALNFDEQNLSPSEVPGWDSAGVVAQAAADGSDPAVGSRVVGFNWAAGSAEQRGADGESRGAS